MPTGTLSTYNLTVGVMLQVEDLIHLLDPFDVPLLGTYGADGRSTLASSVGHEKKTEWLDETLLSPRSTLAAGSTAGATTFTVAAGHGLKFQAGDVIRIDASFYRVTSVNYSTDVLTVTINYGGTNDANHANGAAVVGIGTALPEGSDPEAARAVDRTNRHNFTQIFGPYQIKVSGTENVIWKYGLRGTTEFQHQVANRLKETAVAIEQSLLYGIRNEDTGNNWRTMGGLDYYITVNNDSSTTTITADKLLDQMQACYDAGGSPDRVVLGSKQKRTVSSFDSSGIRYGRSEAARGQVVDWFISDFGQVSMHLNRWMRTRDLFIFGRDQAEVETLRPVVFEPLAKTGDSMKGQIVCEKTLKFRRDKHAAKFSALT